MRCMVVDKTGKFAGLLSGVYDYNGARSKLKKLGLIGYRSMGRFFIAKNPNRTKEGV